MICLLSILTCDQAVRNKEPFDVADKTAAYQTNHGKYTSSEYNTAVSESCTQVVCEWSCALKKH